MSLFSQFTIKLRNMWKLFLRLMAERLTQGGLKGGVGLSQI